MQLINGLLHSRHCANQRLGIALFTGRFQRFAVVHQGLRLDQTRPALGPVGQVM